MIHRLLAGVFCLFVVATPTWASDDDDDLLGTGTPKKGANADVPDASTFKEDDGTDMPSFVSNKPPAKVDKEEENLDSMADPRSTLGVKTKMPVDVVGKDILADNWAPTVVITDADAVVVELPVLYARNRAEFDGIAYWLVAEVYADGKKVAESRMQVTRDAIAAKGPSVQFFRMFAPVPAASGKLEVRVGKAASMAGKPTALFTRSVDYKLGG